MAWDLSHTPSSGIQVVMNGDAHVSNFGLFGTPQRDVILDWNDFDETVIGPWEWDLKRLIASVNVSGRENGLNRKERRAAVMRCVAGYRWDVNRLQCMGILETWTMRHWRLGRKPTVIRPRQITLSWLRPSRPGRVKSIMGV